MENKGRPILDDREKNIREKYRAALKKKAPEALKVIVEVMTDLTARPVDRLRAAEWVLSHCFGNDFVAVESSESDKTLAIKLISVSGRKTENETEQENLVNPEDEELWSEGNSENEVYDEKMWDVDSDSDLE